MKKKKKKKKTKKIKEWQQKNTSIFLQLYLENIYSRQMWHLLKKKKKFHFGFSQIYL